MHTRVNKMTEEKHAEHKEHAQTKHHKLHETHHKQNNTTVLLAITFIAVLAIGTYLTFGINLGKSSEPAEITLTIVGADCEDCFDITPAIQVLQTEYTFTEIKNVTMKDSDALVKKYELARLPAFVFTGDIEAINLPNLVKKEDAMVFTETPAPYYDVAKKGIVGYVTITRLIDSSCTGCFNITMIEDQMTSAGIIVKSRETAEVNSEKGKQLIAKYNITEVPTLLFNKELLAYEQIQQVWADFGSEESDGTLVLRTLNPPYKNVKTGKISGLVNLQYIVDKTCPECFSPSNYYQLFKESFSLTVKDEKIIDASTTEGKNLIKKYNITKLPTVILSQEAAVYPSLKTAWAQVGSEESDGMFVFRNVDMLDSYLSSKNKTLVYKNITAQ